jgi:hypothetical protein
VGDFVLLSAKTLRLQFEGVKKLMHKYFGPFEVVRRVGPVAYELKIPASMKIHDVFHASLLKLYKRGGNAVLVPPPALLPSGGMEYEVEKIVNHRVLQTMLESGFGADMRQFEVTWKSDVQPSWLEESELSNCSELLKKYCEKHNLPYGKAKKSEARAVRTRNRRKRQ